MEQGFESMDWSDLADKSSTPSEHETPENRFEMTPQRAFVLTIEGCLENGDLLTLRNELNAALKHVDAGDIEWESAAAEVYKKVVAASGKEDLINMVILEHYGGSNAKDAMAMDAARPKADAMIARLKQEKPN